MGVLAPARALPDEAISTSLFRAIIASMGSESGARVAFATSLSAGP